MAITIRFHMASVTNDIHVGALNYLLSMPCMNCSCIHSSKLYAFIFYKGL